MFRCAWCEDIKDKSECEENPLDDCSNICWDCKSEYEEVNPPPRIETNEFRAFCAQMEKEAEERLEESGECPETILRWEA